MTTSLESYTSIDDFTPLAKELKDLLEREDNHDIAVDFPKTFVSHTAEIPQIVQHMENARSIYGIGQHEQFIVKSGAKAVGLCVVTITAPPPDASLIGVPNLSGMIFNPYRGKGIGRYSLEQRMEIVKDNFNNKAWTFVREDNLTSRHLVESVGFKRQEHDLTNLENSLLYTFGIDE